METFNKLMSEFAFVNVRKLFLAEEAHNTVNLAENLAVV